jgi:hypothetical protein
MKFKTTIKITTEAKDQREAMEIAGEYLSGNLTTGVDMTLRTTAVSSYKQRMVAVLAVVFIVGAMTVSVSTPKSSSLLIPDMPGNSAILPPMKTSVGEKDAANFKKAWQEKQAQEALRHQEK